MIQKFSTIRTATKIGVVICYFIFTHAHKIPELKFIILSKVHIMHSIIALVRCHNFGISSI